MTPKLHDKLLEKSKPIEFKKSMGLMASTTLGVGALMGAGLYVLVGIASAKAGPGLWIAYIICGLLTWFSVLMFADLSKKLSISGGGYAYAYNQLGSFWGFMVGWHLAIGSIFACALYAYGFATYTASFLSEYFHSPWFFKTTAAALVTVLVGIGLIGSNSSNSFGRILTWGNLLILTALAAMAVPLLKADNFTPVLPNGIGGIGSAISIIYISFFGYQLIANNSEEIHEAKKTVPKAMKLSIGISLFFYILIAVVAIGTVNWTSLSQSDAPLVLVASKAIGPTGAWFIATGGILASGAALNSTILSQSRQIFSMGRDRLLPATLGTVLKKSGVPATSLLAGALAVIAVIVFADLEFIAKGANFSLLLSMLPLSIALHRIYAKNENSEHISTWKKAIPWAAFVANGALLLTLDWQTLMFGGAIVGIGCIIFISYSNAAEKRGSAGFSVNLDDSKNASKSLSFLKRGEKILVPMSNPQTLRSLISLSKSLLPPCGGEIVALKVVTTSGQISPREILRHKNETQEALHSVKMVNLLAKEQAISIRPVVRGAKKLAQGIIHAFVEERCHMLIMGWSSENSEQPSSLLAKITRNLKADIVFLYLKHNVNPRRIGVALGGFGNLSLMIKVASTLAEDYGGEVNYINVLPEQLEQRHIDHAKDIQCEAIKRHNSLVTWKTELIKSDNPLKSLVDKSKHLDLLIIGSALKNSFEKDEIGAFSSMIADQAHCSILIIRKG